MRRLVSSAAVGFGAAIACGLVVTLAAFGGATTGEQRAAAAGSATRASKQPWWVGVPLVEFGRIRSIVPLGPGYELRFDLHLLFPADKTGTRACIDSGDCRAGTTSFPDDTYDRDLKFIVTYYLPAAAPVTLVGADDNSPTVSAAYFYGLAHGRNPRHLKLFAEPSARDILTAFAFYLETGGSSRRNHGYEVVTRLGQVFHP